MLFWIILSTFSKLLAPPRAVLLVYCILPSSLCSLINMCTCLERFTNKSFLTLKLLFHFQVLANHSRIQNRKGQHCCNSKGEPAASTNFLGGMMPGSLQHVARRKKTWHDWHEKNRSMSSVLDALWPHIVTIVPKLLECLTFLCQVFGAKIALNLIWTQCEDVKQVDASVVKCKAKQKAWAPFSQF